MNEKDSASLHIKFNSLYYLAKLEQQFSDYPNLLTLENKNKVQNIGKNYTTDQAAAISTDYIPRDIRNNLGDNLSRASFYSILTDGSANSSVTGQELVNVLFLCEDALNTCLLNMLEIVMQKG